MAILHTDVGGGPTGEATILDQVGSTLHLVRVTPSQMRVLQQAGTNHVPFLQHPDWPSKSGLENHLRMAAATASRPQPTDGEICNAQNLFLNTHKQPLPQSPPKRHQAHRRPLEEMGYGLAVRVPAVLLLAPNGLKSHPSARQNTGQHVDTTPAGGMQIPPAIATAGPTNGHTHHMLAMRVPSTSHAMAHPPTAGETPPHTDGPRYP